MLQSFRNRVQEEMLMIASTEIREFMPFAGIPATSYLFRPRIEYGVPRIHA
jgi:hypothetical protein